jgi:hypothetical protein
MASKADRGRWTELVGERPPGRENIDQATAEFQAELELCFSGGCRGWRCRATSQCRVHDPRWAHRPFMVPYRLWRLDLENAVAALILPQYVAGHHHSASLSCPCGLLSPGRTKPS